MTYVHMHSCDHVDSEYIWHVAVDCKEAKFIGNKQTSSLTHTQTYRHSTLFISTDKRKCNLEFCQRTDDLQQQVAYLIVVVVAVKKWLLFEYHTSKHAAQAP